jgi:serine protease Do
LPWCEIASHRLETKVEPRFPKTSLPATVALLSDRTGASGSGVIVAEDGLILTAAHVVQGAESMMVVFPDGKQVQGKVLGANYSKDIAMVKIVEDKGKWPHVAGRFEGRWMPAIG